MEDNEYALFKLPYISLSLLQLFQFPSPFEEHECELFAVPMPLTIMII